jgi:hypothetical protein
VGPQLKIALCWGWFWDCQRQCQLLCLHWGAIEIDLFQHFVQICYEWIAMARRQNGCCYLADHIYWTHIDWYRWVDLSDWLMFPLFFLEYYFVTMEVDLFLWTIFLLRLMLEETNIRRNLNVYVEICNIISNKFCKDLKSRVFFIAYQIISICSHLSQTFQIIYYKVL